MIKETKKTDLEILGYSAFTGITRDEEGVAQAAFNLARPVKRINGATGSSARVRTDTYNTRELNALITELSREGHDVSVLMEAREKLAEARNKGGMRGLTS